MGNDKLFVRYRCNERNNVNKQRQRFLTKDNSINLGGKFDCSLNIANFFRNMYERRAEA